MTTPAIELATAIQSCCAIPLFNVHAERQGEAAMKIRSIPFVLCHLFVLLIAPSGWAQDPAGNAKDLEAKRELAVQRGLKYLAEQGQADDGTFTAQAGSGLTSLAILAALRNGADVDDPMVAKGLKAMEKFVQPDGGIYGGGRLKNYETCIAIVTLAAANRNGRYDQILQNAKKFVTEMQYGSAGDRDESDPWYGGSSYSGSGRPDLSNTGYMIEALKALDAGANDPAIQRALKFVSRCQNLDNQFNDTPLAPLVNDGGFYYEIPSEPVEPKENDERVTANGGLRSYGSMTYTGLKSMIYAGLTDTDPRVKAATQWIKDHYSVTENPGMGDAGLYYYYHTFGAALKARGADTLTDAEGKLHNWKHDLIQALADAQQADGSWTNENTRWFENDKNLSTSFALIALSYCQPQSSTSTPGPANSGPANSGQGDGNARLTAANAIQAAGDTIQQLDLVDTCCPSDFWAGERARMGLSRPSFFSVGGTLWATLGIQQRLLEPLSNRCTGVAATAIGNASCIIVGCRRLLVCNRLVRRLWPRTTSVDCSLDACHDAGCRVDGDSVRLA